jgi:hypothetical protein
MSLVTMTWHVLRVWTEETASSYGGLHDNTITKVTRTVIHASSGLRIRDLSAPAHQGTPCLRQSGHSDRRACSMHSQRTGESAHTTLIRPPTPCLMSGCQFYSCFEQFAASGRYDKCFGWRVASSGKLRSVALVWIDVSEELSASFIRVTGIDELGTTIAVTSNRRTLRRNIKWHFFAACISC